MEVKQRPSKAITTGMIMDGVSTAPEDFSDKEQNVKDAIENKRMIEAMARYKARHTTLVKEHKIGRNDPCPCGSGKKYKNCCMASGKYEKLVPKENSKI